MYRILLKNLPIFYTIFLRKKIGFNLMIYNCLYFSKQLGKTESFAWSWRKTFWNPEQEDLRYLRIFKKRNEFCLEDIFASFLDLQIRNILLRNISNNFFIFFTICAPLFFFFLYFSQNFAGFLFNEPIEFR